VHPGAVTELDLELLHGLQIAPRISWVDAARILRTTPATLAARWARLRREGLAWITAHRGGSPPPVLALVEVDCVPGTRAEVARALCADRRAVTVEESTRGRDLLVTALTRDLAGLTAFVLDDLSAQPGVQRQRTSVVTTLHRHGGDWRLGALDRWQESAFEAAAAEMRPTRRMRPPEDGGPLLEVLAANGRASAADCARATGRNPATVRRQLARLLASGVVTFRCEVAQVVSGHPISSTWLVSVAPADQERTVAALSTLSELRMCASITGDATIAFTVWTSSLADIARLERRIGERLPWLSVRDSGVNLRTRKRMGWMLDPDGRATGVVVPPV
jgi:DNA-binding Lrp family transcriptional regulator